MRKKRYYLKRDELAKKEKIYREKHRDHRLIKQRAYYHANRSERLLKNKEYRDTKAKLHPTYFEHNSWKTMIQRCTNPKAKRYPIYGGRGIKICESWRKFKSFLADVGPRPEPKKEYSLDRIDSNGNYEPGNVRWATKKQQNNNLKSNRIIEYNGIAQSLTEWAKQLNWTARGLGGRLDKYPIDKAMTPNTKLPPQVEHGGSIQ